MTNDDMQLMVTGVDELRAINQTVRAGVQTVGAGAMMMARAGVALNALRERWDRKVDGNWTEHLEREIEGGMDVAAQCMRMATIPGLADGNFTAVKISRSTWRAIAYLPDGEQAEVLERIEAGERVTGADVAALKPAGSRKRKPSKTKEERLAEKIKKLEIELSDAKAREKEAAKTAQVVADLTDPEKEALQKEVERLAEIVKARDEQIKRSDQKLLDVAKDKRDQAAPHDFARMLFTQDMPEFLRRMRGLAAVVRRTPEALTEEMSNDLDILAALLDDIRDCTRVVGRTFEVIEGGAL
jgi:hypothetical protein